MTQAQVAQWLGVTIKQVKYLEHHRRNPSGPTRRLLSILAAQLKFGDALTVQVVGASVVKKPSLKSTPQQRKPAPTIPNPAQETPAPVAAAVQVVETPKPVDQLPATQPEVDPAPDDGAFAWQ